MVRLRRLDLRTLNVGPLYVSFDGHSSVVTRLVDYYEGVSRAVRRYDHMDVAAVVDESRSCASR